jgi:hypothetical protein
MNSPHGTWLDSPLTESQQNIEKKDITLHLSQIFIFPGLTIFKGCNYKAINYFSNFPFSNHGDYEISSEFLQFCSANHHSTITPCSSNSAP